MELTKKTYGKTEVQITSFNTGRGISEYHLMLQFTDEREDFPTQVKEITGTYQTLLNKLPGNPIPVFRRYFLSDVTNQTAAIMEQERLYNYCALSIVQQAPMNGTKIALWVWLQTGV